MRARLLSLDQGLAKGEWGNGFASSHCVRLSAVCASVEPS